MGYTLGVILVKADFEGRYAELLRLLGLEPVKEIGQISINQASRRDFTGTAVGFHQDTTLLINPFLPYDCSYLPGELNPLDERLAALAAEGPVLCFYYDETSMSFGFSVFQGGERTRGRMVDPEEILSDFGPPLPAEAPFDPHDKDDSQRILALTATFLGEPLDQLIFADQLVLNNFQTRLSRT